MGANAKLVEQFTEAFARGDVEGALQYLHPDVELHPIRAQLEGANYRGHDGYRQLIADMEQDWDQLQLLPDEIREVDDHVLGIGRMQAKGKASGVELDVPLTILWDVRDDLLARLESFPTLDEALEAIGHSD